MVSIILTKTLKVLLIVTAVIFKTSHLGGFKQAILKIRTACSIHYATNQIYFTPKKLLINVLSWEGCIEKSSRQYFLELACRVYSLLCIAFFVNISTPPSFKDNRTSITLSRVYLMSPVSELSTLSCQTKQTDDLLHCLKWKGFQIVLAIRKSQSLVHVTLWWLQWYYNYFLV